jgi:putative transposase
MAIPTAFAADAAAPVAPLAPQTLSCDAPFNKDTTEEALIAAFGKENVEYKTVPGAEGMETNATVIFPNDPAITRLVGALLPEQNDVWQLQQRYLQLEGLQTISDNHPSGCPP